MEPGESVVFDIQAWVGIIVLILGGIFHIWMLVDAARRGEWMWFAVMLIFPGIITIWYFFYMFRGGSPSMRGFELPGAHDRRRVKQLQAQIHHLDKAHHYLQLGDVYFQQGKLDKAEAAYRESLQRDGTDLDTRAHFGQCLLRLKRPAEARPLLEEVVTAKPEHDFGYTMMALAETVGALGETANAILYWEHIIQHHSYARAKVQLAELYAATGVPERARAEVNEVLKDDDHAPTFQRRRDRVWIRRARRLLKTLPNA